MIHETHSQGKQYKLKKMVAHESLLELMLLTTFINLKNLELQYTIFLSLQIQPLLHCKNEENIQKMLSEQTLTNYLLKIEFL